MRLKMRILPAMVVVLCLVELAVAEYIYPIKKGIGLIPVGDSVLFVPNHGKNFAKRQEVPPHQELSTFQPNKSETFIRDSRDFTDDNEKQDDSRSSVESIELESIQSKTLDSGSLANNNEKEGGASAAEASLESKNERQEAEHTRKPPLDKREFNKIQPKKFNFNNKLTNKSNECPLTTVDCLCFEDKIIEHVIHLNLKTISVIDPRTGRRRCFADEDPLAACETRNCVIIPNNNFDTLFKKGRKAHSSNDLDNVGNPDAPLANSEKNDSKQSSGSIVLDSLISAFYPMEYTYPRANGERGNARVARSPYGSNLCRMPSLANSEVTCWKWPNWQTCKQTCIYGHGLDNGGKTVKEASFNCRNTENKWKPHVIRDCEPYLNCKVHLKSPGDLNCVEPTDGPAYCDINCADYDDYVGHGKVRWKCEDKPHGTKQNHLPHCAQFEEAELRLNPPH